MSTCVRCGGVTRWLEAATTPEAVARLLAKPGLGARAPPEIREQDEDAETAPKNLGDIVAHLGFNLHASVTIAAQDDQGRERLCR